MTKAQALYAFWASFGLAAYEESAVPTGDDALEFPYITYQLVTDSFSGEVQLPASVWYRSLSWVGANAKESEISERIGRGGKLLPCDGGAMWIKRGTPFAQNMGDESDGMIRRVYLNLTAEFLTAN